MLGFSKYKAYIACISASLFVMLGFLPTEKIIENIDFNVLLMILGTMGIVSLFIESKMPNMLSDIIIKKANSVKGMTIALAIFSGVVSAFVDNVATVLMIAPVTLAVAKKLKVSPVPIILAVSIFSNLEGAATLVGDTTSILLAGAMKMNFMDFFFYENKIGLFFIVQLGLIASAIVLYFIVRKLNNKINDPRVEKISDYTPTILLELTVLSLIVVSFFKEKPELINGYICMFYFIVGLFIKITKNKNIKCIIPNLKEIDYETIILLASLFVIIGGIKETGAIEEIGKLFMSFGSNNSFIMYTLIVIVSIVVSAFIESPICNISDFLTGKTDGIRLVSEPDGYNRHTLDLFELCIGFQKVNLLEHELFIMSNRLKHLAWAKDNLVPVLEKYDYYIVYDSYFDTTDERYSSNIRIDFKHPNNAELTIEVDCLTGKPVIWSNINSKNGCIDLADKIYGKNKEDVYNILLEEVWKKDDLKFGYIYNNDPHETINTQREVYCLLDCLRDKKIYYDDINFDIIPKRYNHLVEEYNKLLNKEK